MASIRDLPEAVESNRRWFPKKAFFIDTDVASGAPPEQPDHIGL